MSIYIYVSIFNHKTYIYIYLCVSVCVCVCVSNHKLAVHATFVHGSAFQNHRRITEYSLLFSYVACVSSICR